jgi:hypothetical protein
MIWFKSVLVGIAAAIVTAIVTVIALLVPMAIWWADVGEGSGGIGAFAFGLEIVLLPATVAFAIGFW